MNTNNALANIVDRIEALESDKAAIAADIKDLYAEAKGNGFDVKVLRQVISLRKKDAGKRAEEQAILATYMSALGMLADTPLGQAALKREFE
jgi:uncharacterized protein (UPF0335 family)